MILFIDSFVFSITLVKNIIITFILLLQNSGKNKNNKDSVFTKTWNKIILQDSLCTIVFDIYNL